MTLNNTEEQPSGRGHYITATVAVLWSLFQLSVASWWILDATLIRTVHLAFAMLICFLEFPLRWSVKRSSEKWYALDVCLSLLAAVSALYLALDYGGIVERYGAPNIRDLVMGILLVVLLTEATRRVIGPALPIIASLFILYAFLGPHMPSLIAFKGVGLKRFVGQMTMSTEGIYGIPLDVSATIVFLFVLLGAMLEKAGGGRFFIHLALSLLGGFKGGPAKAAILGSGLTGMVSGSSIANIVTTGTFTIPLMKKVGYPPTKAAAIEVAASTDGQLAPPIMGAAAFIIAEYVNVPYLEVVKAAAIPAFASYATLFFISHIEASKLGLSGVPRKELPSFFGTLLRGWHYLPPLFVLLYELVIQRHSPELAAFHAICVMGVIMLLQRPASALKRGEAALPALKEGVGDILSSLAAGARNMVPVALATASAGIIVGVVSLGLGGLITEVIEAVSFGNLYLMLGVTAVASLVIGIGLPTTATYIVMASLTAPAIVTLARVHEFAVPLMAAHLFCFYFGILADDTPPVGLAAYTAAAIAKSPPIPTGLQGFMYDIRTAILPFIFIFNTDLILHGIHNWGQGVLVFAATCFGCFAFASATQGWFADRNRWYDVVLLLVTALVMLRPDAVAAWMGFGIDSRYFMYIPGVAVYAGLFLWQRRRKGSEQ